MTFSLGFIVSNDNCDWWILDGVAVAMAYLKEIYLNLLGGTEKKTQNKKTCHDSLWILNTLKVEDPKYKAIVLTTQMQHLVNIILIHKINFYQDILHFFGQPSQLCTSCSPLVSTIYSKWHIFNTQRFQDILKYSKFYSQYLILWLHLSHLFNRLYTD
jgi:hypothetical protein